MVSVKTTHIEQAVAHCKTRPDYFYTYALVLKKEKRFDESLASFEAAIRLDPNYEDAWWQIVLLLHDLERPIGQVEQVLANVLRLQSNHGGALSLLADIRQKQHRHEESISLLHQLATLHPEDRTIYERMAKNHAADHKHQEALNDIADKEQKNPSSKRSVDRTLRNDLSLF